MDLPGVKGLKSLEDGRSIKAFITENNVKTAVVIGAGYIGLEMVEAFHERGVQVDVCDIMPHFLPWAPKEFDEIVRRELENKGVRYRMGTAVNSIEREKRPPESQFRRGTPGRGHGPDGVGVAPNSELAAEAGLELGPSKAIAVDRYLRTSDPDIYAVGDCADAFHHITGKRVWIPLALRANRGGWAVADNITGTPSEIPDIVGAQSSKCWIWRWHARV